MLNNEDIKFFDRQDIKDAIALEKLDYVYEEYSSAHRLTEILKGLGIDALDYLTILPEEIFSNQHITKLELPDNIVSISPLACYNTSITELKIPKYCTYIGHDAFSDNEDLVTVDLGDSLVELGDGAFSYCASLVEVTIPSTIKKVGYGIFYSCTVHTFNYKGTIEQCKQSCLYLDIKWRSYSTIKKIICTDGELELE